MKTLTRTIVFMAMLFIAAPLPGFGEAIPDLSEMHISGSNAVAWDVLATGHIVIFYECPFHDGSFATLHNVVINGFELTRESASGFDFPVVFLGVRGPGGVFGYVIKEHPSTYIRLVHELSGPRWIYIAKDPSEDGINGNELPW